MSLPKISHPIFNIKLPSTQKSYRFRPFLVKEEKLLLMAKTSQDEKDVLVAIKQVVNNCCLDDLNVDKIALFDLEFLFLRLRSYSVNNTVNVSYRDFEDEKVYEFEIDLNDVQVVFPENLNNTIKITQTDGLVMKYPDASLYEDKEFLESGEESFYQLILRCIEKVYNEDEVINVQNFSKKELEDFVDELDIKTFEKIKDFMLSQPKLSYVIKYKNSLGNNREIELTTLSDFFTLR